MLIHSSGAKTNFLLFSNKIKKNRNCFWLILIFEFRSGLVRSDAQRRRAQVAPWPLPRWQGMQRPDGGATRRSLREFHVPGDGRRRRPALQLGLRRRPVRLRNGAWQAKHQKLLQLVLLHVNRRNGDLLHRHRLRAEQRELGARPRHPHPAHGLRLRLLLPRLPHVRQGASRGQPLDRRRASPRSRLPEAIPAAAGIELSVQSSPS